MFFIIYLVLNGHPYELLRHSFLLVALPLPTAAVRKLERLSCQEKQRQHFKLAALLLVSPYGSLEVLMRRIRP